MVAGSQPLAAPDNLMDGAPEERSRSSGSSSSREKVEEEEGMEDSAREQGGEKHIQNTQKKN